MTYKKLLNASSKVVQAKKLLFRDESFDTKEFTIFIAKKKWPKNILRPLLELCAKDDAILVRIRQDRTCLLACFFSFRPS